tara:strand:+ start:2284 stop:2406 length:123 start_codon:yes stop_codon:yes gene_type:complete
MKYILIILALFLTSLVFQSCCATANCPGVAYSDFKEKKSL